VLSFEGEPWLAGEATPTVRRAYAIGQGRAAEALIGVVQDFAYALEEQDSTETERTRAAMILGWLTRLADNVTNLGDLLPLVDALPAYTLVLREPAAVLTERLAYSLQAIASETDNSDIKSTLAGLLNNLANRLSDLGRREDALANAEEAAHLYRALATTRPDAFCPGLAVHYGCLAI
jgi:hypothetical protein